MNQANQQVQNQLQTFAGYAGTKLLGRAIIGAGAGAVTGIIRASKTDSPLLIASGAVIGAAGVGLNILSDVSTIRKIQNSFMDKFVACMENASPETFACALAFFLFVGQANVSAPSVTLRLMDARSGRPLKGITVTIATWSGMLDPKQEAPNPVKVDATTDLEGRVVFTLPDPIPEHIGFSFSPEDLWGCWGQVFSAHEVLLSGVVADYKPKCGKLKWKASAKPGEIVIFDRKLTKWDKMRREIP